MIEDVGPAAGPARARDSAFKLIGIALLNVLTAARARRPTAFAVLAGFDHDGTATLRDLYRRHQIAGMLADGETGATLPARLADLSGAAVKTRFDCLSVLGRPAVLDAVTAGLYRPGLIHVADTASIERWPELRAGLLAQHYGAIGDLEGAEVFIDVPLFDAAEERPAINSFDVFDTLIARRCLEPWRVFEEVGQRSGRPDFADRRREAEGRLLAGAYTMSDIYHELASIYGLSDEERADLQALEVACEMAHVIPIRQNLERVRDGDLLISDMYLSEDAIRGLLAKAGLHRQVGLFVASHGKSSGAVWPQVNERFKVGLHLGDNPHADIAMPKRFGLLTKLTEVSTPDPVEQALLNGGLRDLALLCREARLATWHDDPAVRTLQVMQTSINFPLLLLASVFLARRASALGTTPLLFCSRDCNLWLPLFEAIQARMGLSIESRYFLTSRLARTKGSGAYLAYAETMVRPGSLVVDLCGTGWSMGQLASRLGWSRRDLFFLDHCPPLEQYENARKTPPICAVHALFDQRPQANNYALELANMAEHGMLLDMRSVGASFTPVFEAPTLSARETSAIGAQRASFMHALDLMPNYALQDALALDDQTLRGICAALYVHLSGRLGDYDMFAQSFLDENAAVHRKVVA